MRTKQNERETADYFAVLAQSLVLSMQKDDSFTGVGLTWLSVNLWEFCQALIRLYSVLIRKGGQMDYSSATFANNLFVRIKKGVGENHTLIL